MTSDIDGLIAAIDVEVSNCRFREFDQRMGLRLGRLLLDMAEAEGLRIAVGIDLGRQTLFRAGLPGTNEDYQYWIDRKFAVVWRFGKASMQLELQGELNPTFAQERALDPSRYALCGGAVPLLVGSCIVGVIGCAGLASIEDHRFIVRVLAAFHKSIDA
jgi:uncharacterized protein (UPF0303 family)